MLIENKKIELTDMDMKLDEITKKYRQQKKEKQQLKKEKIKNQSEENAKKQKEEIVSHIKTIAKGVFGGVTQKDKDTNE